MLTAITREVSPSLADCELTYLEREPIDVARALQQHAAYVSALQEIGVHVVALPAAPDLPDAVFIEDTAVVIEGLAVITRIGAESRMPENDLMADVLKTYRTIRRIIAPGTLDGGDVLHVGHTLYVGGDGRSNDEGIRQLGEFVAPHGYTVKKVVPHGCLHLKSAATYIGRNTIVANPDWVDTNEIAGVEVVAVDPAEPWAANTITINGTVFLPADCPQTVARLKAAGFRVRLLDVSELQKAEAGLSCMSIVFEAE